MADSFAPVAARCLKCPDLSTCVEIAMEHACKLAGVVGDRDVLPFWAARDTCEILKAEIAGRRMT